MTDDELLALLKALDRYEDCTSIKEAVYDLVAEVRRLKNDKEVLAYDLKKAQGQIVRNAVEGVQVRQQRNGQWRWEYRYTCDDVDEGPDRDTPEEAIADCRVHFGVNDHD